MDAAAGWTGKILKRRYRVDERIAIGRTVEVHKAFDMLEDTEVAVKFPLPHLKSDEAFCDGFRAASHRATRLHHPGLVQVMDYGIEDGCPFVVTELVGESNLSHMLETGRRMKPIGALYFAMEMGRILVYLHSQGVTHGSLDEKHIFIFPGRKAKVSDPGFPTVLGGGARPYPLSQDPRRDLQDLGYILYRCLTGKEREEAVEEVEKGELEWGPGVPARLQRLVQLCLQSSGRGGFPSAERMLQETISALREEQPMVMIPQDVPEAEAMEEIPAVRALPRPKRWQIWAGASVLAVALFLLLFWVISIAITENKVEVPNLVDVSVEEARKIAEDLDLGLQVVDRIYDADVKAKYIISQEPSGGEMVRRKTVIKVLESMGPLTVPNLVGLSIDDARMVLEERGFRVGEIVYQDIPEYRENTVVETEPTYGSRLSSGDAVNLVVSTGSGS